MEIFELKTKDGRVFRVATENKTQRSKLFAFFNDNNKELVSEEELISIESVSSGIHSMKDFKKIFLELEINETN